MNIIIAGDGKVGMLLTGQLSQEGHDITLIDQDNEKLENTIELYDVMSICGNCASIEVLKEAGIESADLLIAATNHDEVNLLCSMIAHQINPNLKTIARIRTPEYEETVLTLKDMFGLSLVVNPEKQAAGEIVHLLKYPGFLKRDKFAHGIVEIVELRIDEDSKLRDVSLQDMEDIIHCQTLVCAVLRNGQCLIPSGDFILREDDHIFVTASANNISTLLYSLGLITRQIKEVIIAGGGRITQHLVPRLEKAGIESKIIEKDYDKCEYLAELLPDTRVIYGDVSYHDTLVKEGIENSDALINLTGIDELNVLLGIYGTNTKLPRVITKLSRNESMDFISKLNVGSIVSPKELCSNTIVRYVRALKNKVGAAVSIHTIAEGQAETIEFIVDENTKYCGVPLKDIKIKKNVLITSITKKRQFIFPKGDSTFDVGDRIVVVTNTRSMIQQLNDIFQ